MPKEFVYLAEAQLKDGPSVLLDLEEHGWADPALLARTVRWSLVPKEGAVTEKGLPFPIIVVDIPEKGKAVFKSRGYGATVVNSDQELFKPFRCYGIGYKLGRTTHLLWVLPSGDIEMNTGDGIFLAELLLRIKKGLTG